MSRFDTQINAYVCCLSGFVGIHLLVHGVPLCGATIRFALLAGIGLLLVLGGLWLNSTGGRWGGRKWLGPVVVLVAAGCSIYPVIWPHAFSGMGLAHAVETTRLWPQALVCLFAGLVLAKKDIATRHAVGRNSSASIAPYVLFGSGLTFAAYALVTRFAIAGDTRGANWLASALLGETPIRYLIVAIFFVIASYIVDALMRVRTGVPLTGAIRKFIRTLIAALPLLGFLGTVVGIMRALAGLPLVFSGDHTVAADLAPALTMSLGGISLAFETTLLGLVASLITTLALGYVEKVEADFPPVTNRVANPEAH
ncbi:MotA/TolQ/ExbB proton channel family protein [Breoghania corrubedonensis]|uniref:MotA/TolQ/ExbB proton channel family protein n=1 Tax=Breoghania corrubedonensis TaxID=665038 RepID=A0A2T5UYS3_9HYPH|nr:MotA/TolQ/ExbB proton channel family protein [Breoghania corrubedonensis]PTW56654.1 MotA/TolQ/ExbB proton channel family protein [Breoghania corrubedonensis]